MTKRELIPIWNALRQLSGIKGKVKFAYGIDKNISQMKAEMSSIIAAEKYKIDYEISRRKINDKYCLKDDKGKPIVKDNKYVGIEGNSVWQKELEAAKTVFNEMDAEFEKLISEEAPVFEFYKIKLENFPDDITAEQISALRVIIEE